MEILDVLLALAVIVLVMLIFAPTRWVLAELWLEILKPVVLKQLPRFIHWLIEAHLVVIKNLLPRVTVIKSLSAKYISYDKK